jgi:hypothetical protein
VAQIYIGADIVNVDGAHGEGMTLMIFDATEFNLVRLV